MKHYQAKLKALLLMMVMVVTLGACKQDPTAVQGPTLGEATGDAVNEPKVATSEVREQTTAASATQNDLWLRRMTPVFSEMGRFPKKDSFMKSCSKQCQVEKGENNRTHDAKMCISYCECSYENMWNRIPSVDLAAFAQDRPSPSGNEIAKVLRSCYHQSATGQYPQQSPRPADRPVTGSYTDPQAPTRHAP